MSSSDGLGDREVFAVHNARLSTASYFCRSVEHVVGILVLRFLERRRLLLVNALWYGAWSHVSVNAIFEYHGNCKLTLENILVLLVDVFEDLRGQTEVLSYDRLGGVLDPLVQEESRVFREITTVEDQQELGSVLAQALKGVRVAGWEVPKIAFLQVVNERATLGIECRNADLAF